MNKKLYHVERGIKIKRSQLSNNSYNPNKTTQRQQEAIAESLNSYGQLTSVLVRPDPKKPDSYIIIDGEHRSAILTEEVYVDIVHDIEEADAKKLTIIMNETRGEADKIELAKLLAELESELGMEQLQTGLPYDETELQELVDLASVDWDNFEDNEQTEEEESDPTEDEWKTLTLKITVEAKEVLDQAIALIKEEKKLHEDFAIALGQVVECLAADYLAMPRQ